MRVRRWTSSLVLAAVTALSVTPFSPAEAAGGSGWIGTVTNSGSSHVANVSGPFAFTEDDVTFVGTVAGVLKWDDATGIASYNGGGQGMWVEEQSLVRITMSCTGSATVTAGLVFTVVDVFLRCVVTISTPFFTITITFCMHLNAFTAAGLIWASAGASVSPC